MLSNTLEDAIGPNPRGSSPPFRDLDNMIWNGRLEETKQLAHHPESCASIHRLMRRLRINKPSWSFTDGSRFNLPKSLIAACGSKLNSWGNAGLRFLIPYSIVFSQSHITDMRGPLNVPLNPWSVHPRPLRSSEASSIAERLKTLRAVAQII